MSKAEERAKEFFPNEDIESKKARFGFLLGYHQAENDLELTWEDIRLISEIGEDFMNSEKSDNLDEKEYYSEILSRFKIQKGE